MIACLNNGAKVIERQYRKVMQRFQLWWIRRRIHNPQYQGRPFVLQTPGKQIFVVSWRKRIRELNQASPATLSMHAVAKEVRFPNSLPVQCRSALISLTDSAAYAYHARLRYERTKRN